MDKRILALAELIEANDPAWKTYLKEHWDCLKRLEDFALIKTMLMPFNPGVQVGANLVDPLINGVEIGKVVSAYGAGTAYNLTDTQAAVNLGTTDPAIVLDEPGTWLVFAQMHAAYAAATITTQTMSPKVRRTNNTAADVSVVPVYDLPAATTLTHSLGLIQIPPFIYQTERDDDALALFAALSAAAGAGNVEAVAIGTSIVAHRIAGYTAP